MDTSNLLPCPFCGSTNNNSGEPNEWGVFYVECQDCGARGPAKDYRCLEGSDIGRAKAITAWNQRSAWQPIETAPGDGTMFLAWDGEDTRIAWFVEGRWIYDDDMESPYITPWHPTHWQPLPNHPEAADG